jgi:hypothetical protein
VAARQRPLVAHALEATASRPSEPPKPSKIANRQQSNGSNCGISLCCAAGIWACGAKPRRGRRALSRRHLLTREPATKYRDEKPHF